MPHGNHDTPVADRRRKRDEEKEALKAAMKEWLDEQFRASYESIGKWTVRVIGLLVLSVIVHLMISLKSDELKAIILHSYEAHAHG